MNRLKQAACAALSALTLTAVPACAEHAQEPARGIAGIPQPQRMDGVPLPASLSLDAQLRLMTSSRLLGQELRLRRTHGNGEVHEFYVAVTDLNYNGRLELLISRHTLSYAPLAAAGEGLTEEQRAALTALCTENPIAVQSAAYEVSADGKRLEKLPIMSEGDIAPDFTNLYTKPRIDGDRYIYRIYAPRLTPEHRTGDGAPHYPVTLETQLLWLADGALHVAWTAHSEGIAAIADEDYDRQFTAMEIRATGEIIDPRLVPAELRRRDEGAPVPTSAGEDFADEQHDTLLDLWWNWANQQEILSYETDISSAPTASPPQLAGNVPHDF